MPHAFEELDYRHTPLGELILRRRRPVSQPDRWIYEVKLAGRFLMSSLVTVSERELAARALARVHGDRIRVLVGGLGLGYTAAAALVDARVEVVDVIERLPEVIAWHRRELVPLGSTLCHDPRCSFIEGDCFRFLCAAEGPSYDAVLIDIDDSPVHLLDETHADFYAATGLAAAQNRLRTGGVLALWTSLPAEGEVLERLRLVFRTASVEEVRFDNPLLDREETNAIYFGHR